MCALTFVGYFARVHAGRIYGAAYEKKGKKNEAPGEA